MFPAQICHACAVCFGDPESPMTKGAAAGVVALGSFAVFVLLMIACVSVYWTVRSRRLARG